MLFNHARLGVWSEQRILRLEQSKRRNLPRAGAEMGNWPAPQRCALAVTQGAPRLAAEIPCQETVHSSRVLGLGLTEGWSRRCSLRQRRRQPDQQEEPQRPERGHGRSTLCRARHRDRAMFMSPLWLFETKIRHPKWSILTFFLLHFPYL